MIIYSVLLFLKGAISKTWLYSNIKCTLREATTLLQAKSIFCIHISDVLSVRSLVY